MRSALSALVSIIHKLRERTKANLETPEQPLTLTAVAMVFHLCIISILQDMRELYYLFKS